MENEEWRQPELAPNYWISNHGRVRNKHGKIMLLQTVRGYKRVHLQYPVNIKRCFLVHRLVASAFIGHINGFEVDHIDHDRGNNHINNLRIVTRIQNVASQRPRRKQRNFKEIVELAYELFEAGKTLSEAWKLLNRR